MVMKYASLHRARSNRRPLRARIYVYRAESKRKIGRRGWTANPKSIAFDNLPITRESLQALGS